MGVIFTAGDLYREIKKRGLELRCGEGRDDALYSELVTNLKMPSKYKNLQEFLDKSKISIEEFVKAFLTLVAPFAKMYEEIYSCLQRYGVKKTNESVRMVFDFEKCKLDFDLKNFKEEIRIIRKAKILKSYELWNEGALRLLFEYIRKLSSNVQIPGQHFWDEYYRVGKPYQIPPVPKVSSKLYEQVYSVREIFSTIINTVEELENETKEEDSGSDMIAIFSETNRDQEETDLDNQSEVRRIRNLAYLLTDLIPGFRTLLSMMKDPEYEEIAGKERIQDAIEYFDKQIASQLEHETRRTETKIELLLELLNLPMWKHRWFLYEVCCSLQVVEALNTYNPYLSIKDNKLNIDEGKRWSELAKFDSNIGAFSLFCQAYIETKGIKDRKAIMPDLIISTKKGNVHPEVIILIEFKQRISYSSASLVKLINDYDQGASESILNLFANYDTFPEVASEKLSSPQKTLLLSQVNPNYPEMENQYKRAIVDALKDSGIHPLVPVIDALLLDVSSSMRREYHENNSYDILRQIINEVSDVQVFYFNDDLIDPSDISSEYLTSFSQLQNMIRGGTSLEKTLNTLQRKHPKIKKLLLVTDGDYGSPQLRYKYEISETTPLRLEETWHHLKEEFEKLN